jgi:hypothetical protein
MYNSVKRAVRIGTNLTDWFSTNCGVPQGSILSPILFDVFIDGIIRRLHDNNLGVVIEGRRIPGLLYADDLVLLAKSQQELQAMLAVCESFAKEVRLRFNVNKSAVVALDATLSDTSTLSLLLHDEKLPVLKEYTYLGIPMGHYLCADGKHTKKGDKFSSLIKKMIAKARASVFDVCSVSLARNNQGLAAHLVVLQYYGLIRSRLEYACPIWGPQLSRQQSNALETIQNDFCRMCLGLPEHCNPSAATAELGLLSLQSRRRDQALRYWGKLCLQDDSRLPRHVFRAALKLMKNGGGKRTWVHHTRKLLEEVSLSADLSGALDGLPFVFASAQKDQEQPHQNASYPKWVKMVSKHAEQQDCADWRTKVLKLNVFPSIKERPQLEDWLRQSHLKGTGIKLKLRCGAPFLSAHSAILRKRQIREAGICVSCSSNAAETDDHFLLCCQGYEKERLACLKDIMKKTEDLGRPALSSCLRDWWQLLDITSNPDSRHPTFPPLGKRSSAQSSLQRMCFFLGGQPPNEILKRHKVSRKMLNKLLSLIDRSVRIFLYKIGRSRSQSIRCHEKESSQALSVALK